MDSIRPHAIERQVAAGLGRGRRLRDAEPRRPGRTRTGRKAYVLEMLPYPSGELHMGHVLNYTLGDVVSHVRRRTRLLGAAADGLRRVRPAGRERRDPRGRPPARGDRAQHRRDPRARSSAWAGRSTGRARSRPTSRSTTAGRSGSSSSCTRPGLAYRKAAPVKWCPNDQTVLANEQVIDGRCERCGAEVEARNLEQWMFKITDYADRAARRDGAARVVARARADDAAQLDRPLRGRRDPLPDRGARRGRARLHDAARTRSSARRSSCSRPSTRWSSASPSARRDGDEIRDYARHAAAEEERGARSRREEKTGVFTGFYAVNPVNDARIPIWVADYVLMDYGTGAIMAVPAHDERDFAFAQKFDLPIVQVVAPADGEVEEGAAYVAHSEDEVLVNSGEFTGMPAPEAKRAIVAVARGARPRHAGDQLPPARLAALAAALLGLPDPGDPLRALRHRPGARSDELPVLLPEVDDYLPKGRSPLAAAEDWVNVTCPSCGGAGEARDRHDGHVRRLVLVLPALHRPAQRRGAVRPRHGRLLAAGQPVHRRDRARDPAPDVRALLHEGAERPRLRSASASRSRGSSTRG